ncbi:MAG: S8 family serine peptidase [Deltaproteobacteria bacterium]|nr:S8 family serine peptidase [Deltaproteobacteria bacterium]
MKSGFRSLSLFSLALVALAAKPGYAVTLAVIDSGTDLKHQDLAAKAWINADEIAGNNADDDKNGKADDINGWNFAEKNNQIIDYSYLGTFSKDPYKFFEIQLKMFQGTATPEEKQWIAEKRKDQAFLAELQKFGNFVHGTHVAGIAARDAAQARIMGIKLIPTEVKKPFMSVVDDGIKDGEPISDTMDLLIKKGLETIAGAQGKALEPIGLYVWYEKARVANCSFGTSVRAVKPLIAMLLSKVLKREPTDEEATKYTVYFVGKIVESGRQFTIDAKDTFFVIAAGNDGTSNDEFPTFPANIKRPNTISVAATFGYARLASFSNYGVNKVEIAAPGVGILSAIPGDEHLTVSGTSQASPFVANVAGRVLDINERLTFAELKRVLMETVDKKDFLRDKVASGGIANPERAVRAAELSLKMPLDDAILQSRLEVADVPTVAATSIDEAADDSAMLIEMPSGLKL